eukprot:1161838-Pelagomonas_calceolata.AAC.5
MQDVRAGERWCRIRGQESVASAGCEDRRGGTAAEGAAVMPGQKAICVGLALSSQALYFLRHSTVSCHGRSGFTDHSRQCSPG